MVIFHSFLYVYQRVFLRGVEATNQSFTIGLPTLPNDWIFRYLSARSCTTKKSKRRGRKLSQLGVAQQFIRHIYICMCIYIYVYIYMYVYIYI